jgi:uncharacterized membrane protein
MIIQITALGALLAIAVQDILSRKIPIYYFITGLLATTAVGAFLEGTIFLIYLILFGGTFTSISYLGARTGAWYYGEVLAMPILAAGTYGLNMLAFFFLLITVIPGTALLERKTDLYEIKDEPLLPAFFLVLLLTWIITII